MGIDVHLLTGDNERAARAVATEVGIDHVRAGVTPAGKLDEIARLQGQGHRVGMVGDGVNDAAALARSDLGIAMGTGAGAAIEAADISVLSGDLRGVPRALRLARETHTIVLQNLAWALGYNLIAIPLAMTGLLSPALAAVAMGFSSITVVTNSLRLRRFGRPGRPTPVRSTARRRLSIVESATMGGALLSVLVIAAPNSFAVPQSAELTLHEPAGETLQVWTSSLRPGGLQVHFQLLGANGQRVSVQSLRLTGVSDKGRTSYVAGPGHEISEMDLSLGVWKLDVTGGDTHGHRLGGSFVLPIN
jgi:soluble P-type ATPase